MARQKDENREKAKQLFLDSDGLMKNTEIAEALGIDSAKVRKWKCVDKWNDALENKPKKRGGQKGNKNAKDHGAPVRNKNAETHGAYSKVYFDELSEDEKALIESVTLDTGENTLRELQSLIAKEKDLEKEERELKEKEKEIAELEKEQREVLQKVANLSQEEAKSQLLKTVEQEITSEKAALIRELEQKAKEEAKKNARMQ